MQHRSQSKFSTTQSGFTLVELLVVIFIIGTLAGLLLTNFVGVRGRATDAKIKNDLRQLKSALRLYYNDYNVYPDANAGAMLGCGGNTPPDGTCVAGDAFSGGSGGTVYMKELPTGFEYYSDGDEAFLLVAVLENASDVDIEQSHTRCDPDGKAFFTETAGSIADNEYVVCED
jgi:prepilin-type N-terminal cleavage/methylation domain-containing protein